MAAIALVSVTLNAVNPMTAYFREKDPDMEVRNYLDSYLLEKVKKEGGINDASMKRMFDMLATACRDGADAVLLTCTIFSPYAEYFSKLLSKPEVCPDKAMLQEVAAKPGKTAILCTFTGTVDTTRNLYLSCRREIGREEDVDMVVLPDAYEAASKGDFQTHDRIICKKVMELDEACENIVLAQISMAHVKKQIATNHAEVYTSPDSAYEMVLKQLGNAKKPIGPM